MATFSPGPANESGQAITNVTIASVTNSALFSSQPAISTSGILTFKPAANANGTSLVTFTIQDNGGTVNSGVDTSASAAFLITVTPVNDAPTITFSTNNVVVLEDSGSYSGALATFTTGPANESSQSITNVTVSSGNPGLFSVAPSVSPAGVLTFTPAANANGSATVTVIAQDDGGTANGGVDKATNTFTISVMAVNHAPSFALPAGLSSTGATLWAWGYNAFGQLGNGTTADQLSPVQIGTDVHWQAAAAGSNHTVAVKSDGTLWAWGGNANGQLGDGTTTAHSSPVQIGTDTNWQAVAAGASYTVAVKSDGTLWAWGVNTFGQLGDGTTTERHSPVQIGSATTWQKVTAGYAHTLGIRTDGTLWAWGNNPDGQLGDGTTTDRHSPVRVGTGTTWQSVSAGQSHTVATKSDGTLWTWGDDYYGQLGDASTSYDYRVTLNILGFVWKDEAYISEAKRSNPTQIVLSQSYGDSAAINNWSNSGWSAIAAGRNHTAAFQSSGAGWIWGDQAEGQAGAPEGASSLISRLTLNNPHPLSTLSIADMVFFTNQPAPLFQDGAGDFSYVGASAVSSFALKTDGTLWTMGGDDHGQLGDGTTVNNTSGVPRQLGVSTNWLSLWLGSMAQHTLALQRANYSQPFSLAVMEDSGAFVSNNFVTAISAGSANESGQAVTFIVTNDNNSLFSVQPAIDNNGTLTFTPAPNAVGTVTITVIAQDDGGTAFGGTNVSAPQSFPLTITPVNDAPTITFSTNNVVVLEDSGSFTGALATFTVGAANESSQSITNVTVSNNNPGLFSVAPAIDTNGVLTFALVANANGTATVTVTAQDDGGTANGGVDTSAPQTFTITVTAVNDAPSFTLLSATVTVLEDAGAQSVANFTTNIVAGPADEAAQLVAFTLTNDNNALFSSQPVIGANGTLTFTPAANAYGSATVTVVAQDNGGTANGGVDTSAAQTFTITVNSVNDAPTVTLAASNIALLEDSGPSPAGWASPASRPVRPTRPRRPCSATRWRTTTTPCSAPSLRSTPLARSPSPWRRA
ncbi:MAG: hypothetical protein EBS05_06750 [Proteobacteria bacterium]|nr:hypothetical protein [Pseudomonadota bacterium]